MTGRGELIEAATCHERLRVWTRDGTWERILAEAQTRDDAVGKIE